MDAETILRLNRGRAATWPIWLLATCNITLICMNTLPFLFSSSGSSPLVQAEPPAPPPPVPKTKPVDWDGSKADTDKVPVQVVTLADGHAFFVVGTDTASWPPLVWLFDVASGKWIRQHGDVPPGVR